MRRELREKPRRIADAGQRVHAAAARTAAAGAVIAESSTRTNSVPSSVIAQRAAQRRRAAAAPAATSATIASTSREPRQRARAAGRPAAARPLPERARRVDDGDLDVARAAGSAAGRRRPGSRRSRDAAASSARPAAARSRATTTGKPARASSSGSSPTRAGSSPAATGIGAPSSRSPPVAPADDARVVAALRERAGERGDERRLAAAPDDDVAHDDDRHRQSHASAGCRGGRAARRSATTQRKSSDSGQSGAASGVVRGEYQRGDEAIGKRHGVSRSRALVSPSLRRRRPGVANVTCTKPASRAASITWITDWCVALASALMMTTGSFASPAARLQGVGQRATVVVYVNTRLVDHVATLGVDADVDFLRPILRLLGVGFRQRDLQLRDALVRRRHHQEDQDDEQDVDQRDEVDLGIVPRRVPRRFIAAASGYWRSPCAKSTSLIACCSISTTGCPPSRGNGGRRSCSGSRRSGRTRCCTARRRCRARAGSGLEPAGGLRPEDLDHARPRCRRGPAAAPSRRSCRAW